MGVVGAYQFFAIMSFPSGFDSFFLCCDCLTGCLLDRFFFFWRSRPILSSVSSKVSGSKGKKKCVVRWFRWLLPLGRLESRCDFLSFLERD